MFIFYLTRFTFYFLGSDAFFLFLLVAPKAKAKTELRTLLGPRVVLRVGAGKRGEPKWE